MTLNLCTFQCKFSSVFDNDDHLISRYLERQLYGVEANIQIQTRKSSCVNARGIPPAVYWVLLLLSYLGTPPPQGTPPSWPGREGGGYLTRVPPHPDLAGGGGYLTRVPPQQGTPPVSAPWHSGKCCKALWDMGTPLWTDRLMDRHVSKHYLPVVLRTRAVNILLYGAFALPDSDNITVHSYEVHIGQNRNRNGTVCTIP